MRLKKPIVFFVALAVLAAVIIVMNTGARHVGASGANPRRHPFQLEQVLVKSMVPGLPYFVADVDLDGDDDLLINEPNRLLWYRLNENGMTLAGEGVYEHPGTTQMVADVDRDGRLEYFVFSKTPEGWILSLRDWFSPDSLKPAVYVKGPLFEPYREAQEPWKRMKFFGSFTAVKGGHATILIGVNPFKNEDTSCSLHAYDGMTGGHLWSFRFGPQSVDLACDDFGGNAPRVVFTTFATSKGLSAEGITDDTSYLFCLDPRDGRPLWRKRLGGPAALGHLAVEDLNRDGRNEILVARSLPANDSIVVNDPRAWNVAALDGDGEVLSSRHLSARVKAIAAANLEGDSTPEIIVEAKGGQLFMLNHDLAVRRIITPAKSKYGVSTILCGVSDLKGDQKKELICWTDDMLTVRDHDGDLIAEVEWSLHTADAKIIRIEGKNYIALAKNNAIRILTLRKVPLTARLRAQSRRLTIGVSAAVLMAVLSSLQVRRLLRWRRNRRLTFDAEQNELLIAMAAFGHGGSSLKILDRLRLHLKNWERIRSDGVTREELFARLHRTYGETVVPEIKHIVILARRARVPEGIWDSLLAEADLASKEMEAILASGSEGAAAQGEHIAKALAALDSADGSLAGIRAHMRSVFRAPVTETLERLIARFRYEHEASGISFSLASDPSAVATVFISPVAFDKIFEALLSNAVRATEGKAGAEIAVAIQWEGDYCRIDVRDNGCGIPHEEWDRVFDRTYTTKADGGGFGLYYAREELAKFGAKIYILDSVIGSGTTVRAVLRKSEKAGGA